MKTFYQTLITEFEKPETQAKFTDQNISPVTYIDLYAGQEQFEENFELFAQPALLIDWDIDHQTTDVPTARITFYCCFEQLRDTSNISQNRELGLKFLDYVATIDEVVRLIDSQNTGKLTLVSEGFHKMDSIVDIYLLTYECAYTGRVKKPRTYQMGEYENLDLSGNLVLENPFD